MTTSLSDSQKITDILEGLVAKDPKRHLGIVLNTGQAIEGMVERVSPGVYRIYGTSPAKTQGGESLGILLSNTYVNADDICQVQAQERTDGPDIPLPSGGVIPGRHIVT